MKETDLVLDLDRGLGGAAVIVLAFLRKFFQRYKPVPRQEVRRIIVSKYVGLGSILLSQKLITSLKEAFPNSRVTFLTFDRSEPVLEHMQPCADEVLCISTKSLWEFIRSSITVVRQLRRRNIDLFIDIEFFSRYSSLICFFSGPCMSVGYESAILGSRTRLYSHAAKFIPQSSIIENFVNPLRTLGMDVPMGQGTPKIVLPQGLVSSVRRRVNDLGVSGSYLVFNPSASDALGGYRKWTRREWVRLTRMALAQGYAPIAWTGLESDRASVAEILQDLSLSEKENVYDFSGQFNFREYLAFLSASRAVVTIDSGTSHFSMALGKPTVILFGPETPVLYGYEDALCRVVYKSVFCSPCYNLYHGKKIICGNQNRCMTTITAEEVLTALSILDTLKPLRRK